MTHRLTIENREGSSVLLCECGKPFLEIVDGEVRIGSKHGSEKHENTLTIDDLEMLAVMLLRQLHPPRRW